MGSQRVEKPSGTFQNVRAGRASPHLRTTRESFQANYINALAVSVSPFFEPAKGTLGGFIYFFMTLGELLKFVR
jgi:hypothetical protein